MPVSKPNQIMAGASMHSVKRARDGSANRSMAQNAALGLDNFSRLLQNNPLGTQELALEKQQQAAQVNSKILEQTGLQNATPYTPSVMPNALQGVSDNLQNMSTMQKAMLMSDQPLSMTRVFRNLDASRLQGSDSAVLAMRTAAHKVKDAAESVSEAVSSVMGKLSSLFESGHDGVAAVGYDKVGGTSYGTYQIASNTRTMDEFLKFLEQKAPEYSKELRAAGPANTGSKQGAMPDAWRGIAARDPEGFKALQHDFIEQKHYNAAAEKLAEHGIEASKLSPVMREVLFSTAVQHGPSGAARIVSRAAGTDSAQLMQPIPGSDAKRTEEQVIKRIYGIRQEQFGSSTPYVQQAVAGRLNSEMQTALNMLKTGNLG